MIQKVKKFIRSLQVFLPWLVDVRSFLDDQYFRLSGKPFAKDFDGLRLIDLNNAIIVDVGANRGQCIRTFKNLAPGASITAFEPVPALALKLAARFEKDSLVKIEAVALSDSPGDVTIHVPSYRGYLFDGMASVERTRASSPMNARRFYWFNPDRVAIGSYPITTRTLDSYNIAPKVLKLHAQKAEIGILQGSTKTIGKHHPIIMCAWVWDDEVNYLKSLGYVPHAFRNEHFSSNAFGAEFTWFFHSEHLALGLPGVVVTAPAG